MPPYYSGATNDFMFSSDEPTPCLCSLGRVNQCSFNQKQRQLTMQYEFREGLDAFSEIRFEIGLFNNPLTETFTGFEIEILDNKQLQIAQRTSGISISGVNQAATFKSYTFNYVDFEHSGIYAIHQFIFESSIPVQRGCRIRIVYPSDMTVDEQLVKVEGIGFAQPAPGQQFLVYTIDKSQNSVDIIACENNYGLTTLGTFTLSKVKN